MNIYEKLNAIKTAISQAELKKSGNNKFAGYSYYELADFLPAIIKLCSQHKVYTVISFAADVATLTAINVEKPDETVSISSPMRELSLKGCNEIQALGGIETYQRRYLYMSMFDIVEADAFDGLPQDEPTEKRPAQTKPTAVRVDTRESKRDENARIAAIGWLKQAADCTTAAKDILKSALGKYKVRKVSDLPLEILKELEDEVRQAVDAENVA